MKTIFLSGKIPKGDIAAVTFTNWRERYEKILKKHFDCKIIEPYHKDLEEGDFKLVVGSDSKHIKECDLLVVNAEEKIGAGTAQELVIAKYFKIPVISVLPKDSHHRRSNVTFHGKLVKDWIHPFIFIFSDFIIESIEEIKTIEQKIFSSKIKDMSTIDETIRYFEKKMKQK
jgi:hypothetical protein